MSKTLTDEQIREELLKLNYNCGPITGTTRDIYLKKLESLRNDSQGERRRETITDEKLRSELILLGESVAPITDANRQTYMRRLEKVRKSKGRLKCQIKDDDTVDDDFEGWEPMEID